MQAIILAAGMGKRLKELTQNNTKCMVKVCGVTLVERLLRQLDKKNLTDIVIVVGYEGQKLIDFIATLDIKTPITYIDNPIYDKTNNIYSLALAKDWLLKSDTLLFESDIIFEEKVIDLLLEDPRDTLALVDKYESWMDGTCVKLSEDDSIEEFVPGKKFNYDEKDEYYKTVNIYKFSKHFSQTHYVPFLDAYTKALGDNEYYEQVLRVITMLDDPEIKGKRLSGQKWYEIDDAQDLDIAETLFAGSDDERFERIQKRYGGYWRYPGLLDYCYLVNPYFPPKKMVDEIKASFYELLTQYPSGMAVNSLLASKNFGPSVEQIVVGNGAAELIKALMENIEGKFGVVRPTFEEYPNRYDAELTVTYCPQAPDYKYSEDDLIDYFSDKNIQTLLLINPDNPTGNCIDYSGLLKLISWTKDNGIKLILDESFCDFADEDITVLDKGLFNDNKHLYVVKSISKSYGVPGLRLGILASGDTDTIAKLKKQIAIWNINSFAEFYMQIYEKYKKDYAAAIDKFKKERSRFVFELKKIKAIRAIDSQANYICCELNGIKSRDLAKKLLIDYNIFIKDLSSKMNGEYIRLAVRNNEDNDRLIKAVKEILS